MIKIFMGIWLIFGIAFPIIKNDLGIITIVPLVLLFIFPFVLCLIDKIFKTCLSCKTHGWHDGNGKGEITFDGCSIHATCSKCGEDVMLDGQGNWF